MLQTFLNLTYSVFSKTLPYIPIFFNLVYSYKCRARRLRILGQIDIGLCSFHTNPFALIWVHTSLEQRQCFKTKGSVSKMLLNTILQFLRLPLTQKFSKQSIIRKSKLHTPTPSVLIGQTCYCKTIMTVFASIVNPDEDSYWSHLFCSSSLASSSSSSGLRFSESAGEAAGADSSVSWEDESGLSTGLPVDEGSGSMPGGEEGHSSSGGAPLEPSLSGLPLGRDMAVTMEWDGWSSVGVIRGSSSLTVGLPPQWAWLSPDWPPGWPLIQYDQRSSNLSWMQKKLNENGWQQIIKEKTSKQWLTCCH